MSNIAKIVFSKETLNSMQIHRPNKEHARECIVGQRVTKNKKKYTRKIKHKNNYI